MSDFLNIFSKEKIKTPESPKIIIDHREKNSLVISKLIKLGAEIEIKELKIGDYVAKDTIIERKSVSDFIASMMNQRLLKQIEELKLFDNKMIIIEGIREKDLYSESEFGINKNATRGFILSILLKHKIPILFTQDEEETAQFLIILSKKKTKNSVPLNKSKISLNKKDQALYILESFPGIGPKNSQKLLKEFGSLKNIFNASANDLKNCIGKKSETFKLLDYGSSKE